jgi:hypothetical protein
MSRNYSRVEQRRRKIAKIVADKLLGLRPKCIYCGQSIPDDGIWDDWCGECPPF